MSVRGAYAGHSFEMFNGFVNIDKKYLDVDKLGDEIPDEVLFSGEEIVDIESAVNYKGPCVVYLAREFISTKRRMRK